MYHGTYNGYPAAVKVMPKERNKHKHVELRAVSDVDWQAAPAASALPSWAARRHPKVGMCLIEYYTFHSQL